MEPYGLATPALSIAAYDEKGQQLASVLTTQRTEGETKKAFAMAEGRETVLALRDYIFDRLNKTPHDFWEKPKEKETSATATSEASSASSALGEHVHEEALQGEEESH